MPSFHQCHRRFNCAGACPQHRWASLYGERVLAYRAEQHLSEEPAIAVIIQKMIFSRWG